MAAIAAEGTETPACGQPKDSDAALANALGHPLCEALDAANECYDSIMDSKPGRGTLSKQERRRCMDAWFMKKPSGPEFWTKAGFTQLCKSALPEGYRIHREALKVLDPAATAAMAQAWCDEKGEKGIKLSIIDIIPQDLQEALELLQRQKIHSLTRLAKLTDAQWQRLNLALGIEALLREAAEAQLAGGAPEAARARALVEDGGKAPVRLLSGLGRWGEDALGRSAGLDPYGLPISPPRNRGGEFGGCCFAQNISLGLCGWHFCHITAEYIIFVLLSVFASAGEDGADLTLVALVVSKKEDRRHEACWDNVHTFERCCGEDCLDSLSFNVERCCDLVQSETGDQACWQGTHHSFEHCCQPRAGEAGASAYEGLPSLPEFGEGCWDAEQLITFARCCGTPGVKDYCFVGEYTYGRCCTGLHPIPRSFLDVPLEHELVRCLREARDGGISSNGSYEECNGRYFHVSAVLYRYAEFEVMHDFWWQRPQDPQELKKEEIFSAKGRRVTAPEWLHHSGSICAPQSCSEEAMAGWFAPLVDVGQHYIWPKYRQLNDTHMRVSPLNARKRPYPKFEGSWLSYRPAADALLRQQQKLQNYFEFVLTEHKTLRQLRLSRQSCGVLLALTLPILTASVLLALGVQAAKPLALQSSVMRLGMPRPLCFDVFRIITSIFIVAVHVKDHYSFPDLKDDSDNRIYNYVISAVEATPVNSLAVMLLVLLELRHLDAIGSARLAVSGPLSYLRELTKHLLRRWVLIMSIVGIWLYFYIAVFIQEVEIPNIGKSKFLYIWFWRNRISCQRPVHLLPTVLLLHEAAHAYETPCHNLNIFEAYRIAVFNYPSMGGSGVGDCGDETVNLRSIVHNSLVSTGAEIEESITSFSQSGFDSLLYACNVFIMPEMESSSPDPADTSFFPASAQVSLLQWVEAGGMLISFYGGSKTDTFLNLILGTDFARPSSSSSPWSNTGQYTFGSTVASSLASPSATSSWDLSTSGASPIYGNTSDAVVFRYSRVSGVVWGLGWDFYDSGSAKDFGTEGSHPDCTAKDNDFVTVFTTVLHDFSSSAVTIVSTTSITTLTTTTLTTLTSTSTRSGTTSTSSSTSSSTTSSKTTSSSTTSSTTTSSSTTSSTTTSSSTTSSSTTSSSTSSRSTSSTSTSTTTSTSSSSTTSSSSSSTTTSSTSTSSISSSSTSSTSTSSSTSFSTSTSSSTSTSTSSTTTSSTTSTSTLSSSSTTSTSSDTSSSSSTSTTSTSTSSSSTSTSSSTSSHTSATSSSTSWTTLTRSSSSTTSSSSSSSSTSSTMSTSEAKPISAAQLEEMEAQRKEEAAAAVQKVEAAEEAAVASALNQLFDQPRDPSAPPGMLGATTVKTETGPVKVAAFSPEALARAGGVARVGSGRNGEESAAELEVSSDLLAEAAASSGISGPILLSMGSLNDQAVANLKTDHPLAQGRRLASALKSQAVSINFRDETGKKISVKNLQTPMKIILKVQDASARCAYWDEVNSQWSEEGVTTSDEVAPESSIICLTTHLSLFGGVVNAVVRNVALALECSTLSSVMDDAAFQKLFDGEWLAKPQSVVSILFMIISIASVLVALRCDHQSEQLLPSQDREEMLMRVKAGQSEEEEAGAEPEASLQQTLFQQVRSAAEQVLDFLAQASGGNGFLEAVKEGVANAQTAAVNRGLSTLQAFRSRTDQASMNIVHLHGESQKDPPSDVQHANMAIPRLDAHNMASRLCQLGPPPEASLGLPEEPGGRVLPAHHQVAQRFLLRKLRSEL
ncbi:unnamed protein product [Durusdinium trenchii]|uniref:GPS domain-containing protein n=1 Tax=Durusdinium trenchii TaxID=1381693 RepID=A0ABP0PPX6_9DINO